MSANSSPVTWREVWLFTIVLHKMNITACLPQQCSVFFMESINPQKRVLDLGSVWCSWNPGELSSWLFHQLLNPAATRILKSYPCKDCACIRLYWNLLQFEKKKKIAGKKKSERDYLTPNTEFKLWKDSKSHEASGERRTLRWGWSSTQGKLPISFLEHGPCASIFSFELSSSAFCQKSWALCWCNESSGSAIL